MKPEVTTEQMCEALDWIPGKELSEALRARLLEHDALKQEVERQTERSAQRYRMMRYWESRAEKAESALALVQDAEKWNYDNIPGYAQMMVLRSAMPLLNVIGRANLPPVHPVANNFTHPQYFSTAVEQGDILKAALTYRAAVQAAAKEEHK